MLFVVKKTYSDDNPPFEGAVEKTLTLTTSTYSGATTKDVWTLELDNLSDLFDFINKHGGDCRAGGDAKGIILMTDTYHENIDYCIEIYDDWRE